jgi:membrane-bound lytic murein transglycosylase B
MSIVVAMSAGLLVAGPVVLTPAHADPASNLSSHVQALLTKVHALQTQAKAAEQRYQQAFSAVADSVSASINDDQASSEVVTQAADAQAILDERVQSLYESGGELDTDAAILTAGSVTQLVDRNELASSAAKSQLSSVHSAISQVRAATAAAAAAERRAHRKIGTERTVAAAANQVSSLLAQESALLKQANKQLVAVRKAAAALAAQAANFSAITAASIAGLHILPPSAQYLALYRAAAPTCPGLSWTVLAAIGQVETGHGRNQSTSSAGAQGPMQFEPATFAAYAVDGDHDGVANIGDPADAIFTAAHYLCANGGGLGGSALDGAILHYNHAQWYVAMVLKLAGMYATTYS